MTAFCHTLYFTKDHCVNDDV